MIESDTHKRGDGFLRTVNVPSDVPDGYFAGWGVACQLRDQKDNLVATLDTEWVDAATTRQMILRKADTSDWPISVLGYDIQFERPDGWLISSSTMGIRIERDITKP